MIIKILLIIILIELSLSVFRQYKRKTKYKEALQHSEKVNKKLIVIGAPFNGMMNSRFKIYGCGDICIDLIGCSGCKKTIKGDLIEVLKKIPHNKYVIFESCVLEYINKKKEALDLINKVSGGHYYSVRIFPSLFPIYFYKLKTRLFGW